MVSMSGAVINTVNTRLDADTIAYILEHGEARMLLTDTQLSPVVRQALANTPNKNICVVDIVDDHPEKLLKGLIGPQLHAGQEMECWIRNVRLKKLK